MALSQFQISLLAILTLLSIGVIIVLLFWISKKYPSKKKGPDPVLKYLIILLVLFMAHLTLVIFGVVEQEQLRESIKYYVISFLAIVGFFIIKKLFLDRPIPTEKLLKQYVIPSAKELYGAERYKGTAAVPTFLFSTVIPSGYNLYSSGLEREGVDLMEVFLIRLAYGGVGTVMDVMDIRNKFTGEGLQHMRNPDLSMIHQWMGREVMRSYQEREPSEEEKADEKG